MKITIIFPGRSLETARPTGSVMPLAPTLLAALTPDEHEVSIVDMFMGDKVDYESDVDVVAITVRTPLAVIAYEIADNLLEREKKVILGGPHVFCFSRRGQAARNCRGNRRRRRPLADYPQGCRTRQAHGLLCLWALWSG